MEPKRPALHELCLRHYGRKDKSMVKTMTRVGFSATLLALLTGCSTTGTERERVDTRSMSLLDTSVCPPDSNIIVGSSEDDVLEGTDGVDCILGGDGNDTLIGGNGDDVLVGGAGDDELVGGNGDDRLYGEDGNDQLAGNNGSDTLEGGDGNDILNGDNGTDELDGGPGNDVLIGGNGKDVLDGGDGDDSIDSGNGSDDVSGGPGTDACDGSDCENPEPEISADCSSDSDCAAGSRCTSVGVCVLCLGDVECDDGNPCTTQVCTPLIGCSNPARPDGHECDNDTVCDGREVCQAGVCTDGTPLECDNGQFCDGLEYCEPVAGCTDGEPPVVDDGRQCTADSCNETEDRVEHVIDDSLCGRLFGWADLHAHPASHLGLGIDEHGENGIFWGKPGKNLEESLATLPVDMRNCFADSHRTGFIGDLVVLGTHQEILSKFDEIGGHPHGPSGYSAFADWPHAHSLTHQQMHITQIRRAYEGGLRVMIASVTNNQLVSRLWRDIRTRILPPFQNAVPEPREKFDFMSALIQLRFIEKQAEANPDWMQVAYSAAEAREIVENDKLAIILSLELDSLTPAQTLELVRDHGVRQVIPVHLIDNEVGGTALSDVSDAFNTANAFIHSPRHGPFHVFEGSSGYFHVEYDPNLSVRLSRPERLIPSGELLGALTPVPVPEDVFAELHYLDHPGEGHKNARGIQPAGEQLIRDLAREGVLIDVAHMGEHTADWVIESFAQNNDYPVMDSHTGLRGPLEQAGSERQLKRLHAFIIGGLGGMIGLGTEGSGSTHPIADWLEEYGIARTLLRGRGVALGTDLNGFQKQLARAPRSVSYPDDYPLDASRRFGNPRAPLLEDPAQLGDRRYDFESDGIAHYGMLPDFVEAVANEATEMGAAEEAEALFHSARDVIEMWERAEAAAENIP